MTTNKLSKNEKLEKGEFLRSTNLVWRAVFQVSKTRCFQELMKNIYLPSLFKVKR